MAKGNGTPVTRLEFRAEMAKLRKVQKWFATKKDLKRFATKKDLERFATKEALAEVAALTRQNTEAIAGNTESIRLLATQMLKVHDRLDRIETTMSTKAQVDKYASAVDMFAKHADLLWNKHLVHDNRLMSLEKRADDHEGRLQTIEGGDTSPDSP